MNTHKYIIINYENETWVNFLTRIANEILTFDCKIVSMDIDIRVNPIICTIEYINHTR